MPGPAAAVAIVSETLDIAAPPRSAREILSEIVLAEGWAKAPAEADEVAGRWERRFLFALGKEYTAKNVAGRVCRFEFNSSSEYMVQGTAFVEPTDSEDIKQAKRRRARLDEYVGVLANLSPKDFEAMSRGVLDLFGVDDATLTPLRADQGIDFYGHLKLEDLTARITLPNVYRRLTVWMIGQAKKYEATQVATPDIRELVGSIDLAKGKAFSSVGAQYEDLDILVCDPVFYLFFTTGTISADGWRLLERSGVIGMDGLMVAAFLADNDVGVENDNFRMEKLEEWLEQLRPK